MKKYQKIVIVLIVINTLVFFLVTQIFMKKKPLDVSQSGLVFDISMGSVVVDQGTTEGTLKVTYSSVVVEDHIDPNELITIIGYSSGNNHNVSVLGTSTVHIKLQDVFIDNTAIDYGYGVSVEEDSTLILELEGDNVLKAGDNVAGIQVSSGNKVIISAQNQMQNLSVMGGKFGSGIGGGDYEAGGNIHILGGSVNVTGGWGGSGIGSGRSGSDGGSITISGGSINAIGGQGASGIGGGEKKGGVINISGGNINTTGGGSGAGIGGGGNEEGGIINISGGNIMSKGGSCGAGIGGGQNGIGGNIDISDGDITAIGGKFGAGIGGGYSRAGENINISGGTIVATGGRSGAGIGGGADGDSGIIDISNSTITATGGNGGTNNSESISAGGAGIGSGGISFWTTSLGYADSHISIAETAQITAKGGNGSASSTTWPWDGFSGGGAAIGAGGGGVYKGTNPTVGGIITSSNIQYPSNISSWILIGGKGGAASNSVQMAGNGAQIGNGGDGYIGNTSTSDSKPRNGNELSSKETIV